jgi:hypothetical protein
MFASDAYNLLGASLTASMAGLTPLPAVNLGWPAERTLMALVAQQKLSVVNLYDLGRSRDASRFLLFIANEIDVAAGITSVLSASQLSSSVTVTLGGTVGLNDAVSFVAQNGKTVSATVAVAGASDTPTSMASNLASAINSAATLSNWVSASATANVVTVYNLTGSLLIVASNVGNGGTRYVEEHRVARAGQVNVWTPTAASRDQIARIIDTQLSYLDAHFGLSGGPDQTWVRTRYLGDQMVDEDVYRDLYRWLFHVELEYGQTYAEALYTVLAFIPQQAVILADGSSLVLQ